jgi:DNA-binding CsgD family transcriptional regulator/tetratricopeptide (TPR) repeat protein
MRARAPLMLGREQELRTLGQMLRAAQAGRGGSAFVIGEAGIGKSRLAAEAADLGLTAGMRLLRGRGSSVGPTVPFRPLTEALMFLLREGNPIDVGELGPYRPVLGRLVPDWGTQPARADGGSLVLLAEAVLRLTGLVGREHGCLLVLDDIQDSDVETLTVVDYLVSNLDRQPAMLLGTIRPETSLALDLVRSAAQRGCGALIELGRLGAQDVHRLAASCLGADPQDVPSQVIKQLWEASEGIPLLVEELLNEMLRDRLLVHEADGWRVRGKFRAKAPSTLTRAVAGQLDRIGAEGRELLSMAAVLGRRFPLPILQAVCGMGDREMLSYLHADLTAQLVMPDEQTPDWYAFRHPLLVDAVLALITPAARSRLTAQAAAGVEAVYPGLPGEWCQVSAALHAQAGDTARAGRLFAEAGRRAFEQGAANTAVTLLDRALELLVHEDDVQERADAYATLLFALPEAGMVERAVSLADEIERVGTLLSRESRALLHVRLAWTAAVAGRTGEGLAHVDIARKLLGPDASDRDSARIDVVAAHLMLDLPGPDQIDAAEALARRAAEVAETAQLPIVACRAWQLLGALSRSRDPAEASACLERALQIATQHDLQIEVIHALIRLGRDDALRDGSLDRLERARREASRVGAVTARYQAEVNIALQAILGGDFTAAEALIDQVLVSTKPLGLLETTRQMLLLRAVLFAHRGMRREMDAALAELHRWGGDGPLQAPRIYGLARAWCALLEENRPRALEELSLAVAAEENSPTILPLTGRYGLRLLLRVLDGVADQEEYEAVTAEPISRLRWDRQFALFASAVLSGRAGRAAAATGSAAEAIRLGAPYATGRHMALRLVSEAAIVDHWGAPIEWLQATEDYFHNCGVPAVASACRAMLRRAGAPVSQHRRGIQDIPSDLRAAGVTVREYEILQLLTERLSNRELATRLHLSPRTVEKHVASLLIKTGQRDRIALGEYWAAAHQ